MKCNQGLIQDSLGGGGDPLEATSMIWPNCMCVCVCVCVCVCGGEARGGGLS